MAKFGNWQEYLDLSLRVVTDNGKLNQFMEVPSLVERIKFINQENLCDAPWISAYFEACQNARGGKSESEARRWRLKGNKEFCTKQYRAALLEYNKCVQRAERNVSQAEGSTDRELPLGLANRSAALFHLAKTQACLDDVEWCLREGYPARLQYKVYQRQASCLFMLGHTQQAEQAVKLAETAIRSLDLDEAKKSRLLQDLYKIPKDASKLSCVTRPAPPAPPEPHNGSGRVLMQASESVDLRNTEHKGRHLVANALIKAGEPIIVERPFAAVLLPTHYSSHCHHCCGTILATVPCPQCCVVSYCSTRCQQQSWKVYHSVECPYLDLFHSIGIAHLSLRIVLTAGLQQLLEFRSRGICPPTPGLTKEGRYERSYLSVYDLMPHDDHIPPHDMLQYAMTAGLLLRVLKESKYFQICKGDSEGISPADELYIGSLLLRHICQLVCNAHAITELRLTTDGGVVDASSQQRVATAIYPTASLINHSCRPTIISSFIEDVLVVRTVHDVEPGEEIFNCYGPHHGRMSTSERRQQLRDQYFFHCECVACTDGGHAEAKQQAYACPKCKGPLLPHSKTSASCLECSESADLSKLSTKAVNAQELFKKGLENLQESNIPAAIGHLRECHRIRQSVLYRENRSLGEICDVLARCLAMAGDFKKAADYLKPSVHITEAIYGTNSIELANELLKYSEILVQARKLPEALTAAQRSREIFSRSYGAYNAQTTEVDELITGIKSTTTR